MVWSLLPSKHVKPRVVNTCGCAGLVHHYHRSIQDVHFIVATWGYWLSLANTSEASAPTSWVCHADCFPLPRKAETTSQPVKACNNVIPLPFSGPIERHSSMCRNPPHIPALTKCNPQLLQTYRLKVWHNAEAMTRISVSLAFTKRDLLPSCAACLACTKICMSASS